MHDNVLCIISVHCSFGICCFKCMSSLKAGWILIDLYCFYCSSDGKNHFESYCFIIVIAVVVNSAVLCNLLFSSVRI